MSLGALTSICDPNAIRDDSKLFYAKNNDVAFKINSDLAKLTGAAATAKAFDGLSRMAVVRGTNAQASTATAEVFDHLAKGYIGCMEAFIRQGVPNVDFALDFPVGRLFAVRGNSTVDPTGGAYQNGNSQKYWAVETPGNGPWENALSQSPSKRFLVYEASPPATFLNTNGRVGSVTDIATIPTIASGNLKITLNVGLCDVPFTGDVLPPGLRVDHANTYGAYVALACTRGSQLAAARSPFDPRVLAQRAIDFFSPRTLNAAVFGGLGSVGIGLSDISPVGVFDLTAVVLDSLGTITNGNNTTPLTVATNFGPPYGTHVVVRARATADLAKLQGIPIEMAIQGNSSNIAFFGVGPDTLVTVTRTTDANGYADFGDVRVTKAGGYILNFRVHFIDTGAQPDVVGAQILSSNSFQIQNKN
jgi:hypothetical protein